MQTGGFPPVLTVARTPPVTDACFSLAFDGTHGLVEGIVVRIAPGRADNVGRHGECPPHTPVKKKSSCAVPNVVV